MEENINNKENLRKLQEEEMKNVSGGAIHAPQYGYEEVEVKDGPKNSALCPYCSNTTLTYNGPIYTYYGDSWDFKCPKCQRRFVKVMYTGKWYVQLGRR